MRIVPPHILAVLDIDLAALRQNILTLQARVAPRARLAGVVKANAYGIGLAEVAGIHKQLGTQTFFAATPEEGADLRAILGSDGEIAILCGLVAGAAPYYRQHHLTPVLNSLAQLAEWKKDGQGDPAILHLDTGMRRLGLESGEADYLLAHPDVCSGVNVTMVMSHFACADEPDHPLTGQQNAAFERFSAEICRNNPEIRRSLSNSAGIFASPAYHYDVVRPGMAVYGLNPIPGKPNPMKQVVQLRARVLQTRKAQAGNSVGYGASYICPAPRCIATVALGYADGFLRALSNRGVLFWNGQPCPVLGRVSMDVVTLDITDITGPEPVAGDWVDVLGPDQDADHLAQQAGTIGYEILTGLSARYHRRYHDRA